MQLAQVNIGRLRAPADSPQIAEFAAALDRINGLADRAAGFVWRHSAAGHLGAGAIDTAGHLGAGAIDTAGHLRAGAVTPVDSGADPLLIVNLSVWTDYPHLHDFTYRTAHMHYLRRRLEWFERLEPPVTALWWVPDGERPGPGQAMARLHVLRRYGPTPQAFSVRVRFDPAGSPDAGTVRPAGRPATRFPSDSAASVSIRPIME